MITDEMIDHINECLEQARLYDTITGEYRHYSSFKTAAFATIIFNEIITVDDVNNLVHSAMHKIRCFLHRNSNIRDELMEHLGKDSENSVVYNTVSRKG